MIFWFEFFFKNQPKKSTSQPVNQSTNKATTNNQQATSNKQKMALISDYNNYDNRVNRYAVKTTRNHSSGRSGDDVKKYRKEKFELFIKEVYEFIIDFATFIAINILIGLIIIFIICIFLHRHKI